MAIIPDWAKIRRAEWQNRGQKRPPFAIDPKDGEESVWDYPRPPAIIQDSRTVTVKCGDELIAETNRAIRILETASPPTFYIPKEDINTDLLITYPGSSACEWKGNAKYWSVQIGSSIHQGIAWSYPDPFEDYIKIKDHLSFYPAKVDCYINGEKVRPQPGGFYGGWITNEIIGPFKGEADVYDR